MTERRITTLLAALLPLLVLMLLSMFVTVPYVAVGPGDTADTLGKYRDRQILRIEGLPIHQPDGELRFTTVGVTDGLNLYGALARWAGGDQLVPRYAYFPPGSTREQVEESNRELFVGSESAATVAALRHLKIATATGVTGFVQGGPADRKLHTGDVIEAVGGQPVSAPDQVTAAVTARQPGETISIGVRRADGPQQVDVELGEADGKARLGIMVGQVPADPRVKVGFDVDRVGGPSAGLMLTLGIIDLVEPGDLTGGAVVAGTGEITADGTVGPIGGIKHKLVGAKRDGASVFLVPAQNCREATSSPPPAGLQLVKVENLDGAITALADVREGRPAPSC